MQKKGLPGTRQACPFLVAIVLEALARAIRQGKKRNPTGKEEVKLLLLADDVVLFTENPKDTSKKLPEIINE